MRHLSYMLFGGAFALLVTACASSGPGGSAPDAGGGPQTCDTTSDCEDDGQYCNGGVICREHECLPTDAPDCGDGINCTIDSCSEELLGCFNAPHDELCDPGLACLDAQGCGTPPACEFANDCNDDAFTCNGVPDCIGAMCISTPLDCDDHDACTEDQCAEPGGCEHDAYDFMNDVDHCTAACTPCPEPTVLQVHTVRTCEAGVCGLECVSGYWNVDNDWTDGCEVGCDNDPTTTVDIPDDGFEDQNCDGIDGTVTDGIFVAEDGSNANPGTMAFPVKSINTGMNKAIAAGKHHVYISAGDYNETVVLDATHQGIGLHGGYLRSSNWLRDGTRGSITGPRTGALRATNVTSTTIVEYLQFTGASATVPSTSSHGIVVQSSTGFRPRNLTAVGGNGAGGTQGSSAGSAGDDGGNGTVGAGGYEDDGFPGCSGNQPDPPVNYDGGSSCVGAITSTRGGDGHRGCITNGDSCAGSGGDAGSPDPAGTPSDGGTGVTGGVGNGGKDGSDGTHGTDGGGGNGGIISGTEWTPRNGSNGGRGNDGTGGGGGAGGGSNHSFLTCNDWGGGGGGGGGGGCGGTGGDGGTGGGASIAILLINSSVTAVNVDTVTYSGGVGGNGRSGGGGGPGGTGRAGGGGADEGRAGGAGGAGGDGGRGGHGGGGAGGWVVGIYRSSSTWSDGGTTTPVPLGSVGNGGTASIGSSNGTAGSYYPVY